MEKREPLSKKQQEMIKEYLSSRLGKYGLKPYGWKYEKREMDHHPDGFTQALELDHLGIFGQALTTCLFIARVWGGEDGSFTVDCRLGYEHVNGGSNGCTVGVKLRLNGDRIVEI